MIAMRWDDIDFESGRVHLRDSKTGSRVHDLPRAALPLVQNLPRYNTFVFSSGRMSPRPAPVTYRTVRRHFLEVVAAAGLNDVRLHDLRRTLITVAAASGENVFVVRGLLGHQTTVVAAQYVQEGRLDVRGARERAGSTVAAMMDGTRGNDGMDSSRD